MRTQLLDIMQQHKVPIVSAGTDWDTVRKVGARGWGLGAAPWTLAAVAREWAGAASWGCPGAPAALVRCPAVLHGRHACWEGCLVACVKLPESAAQRAQRAQRANPTAGHLLRQRQRPRLQQLHLSWQNQLLQMRQPAVLDCFLLQR